MSIAGVDLGTSGVRAVAFSAAGEVVAVATHSLQLSRPRPGRVELDPAAILNAAETVVRVVAERAREREDPLEALAFSVLGEAVLPVDNSGTPVAPVAVSMDSRGEDAARRLADTLGRERFSQITGQPLHGMFSGFKIAAGDSAWQNASAFRCVGDFLSERWTGRAVIDISQAARTGLFDVQRSVWSEEIIDGLKAPWIRAQTLAKPVSGGVLAGRFTAEAAARLGVADGLPVVAGAHDQAAAYLGVGGSPGEVSAISFGSSDCVTVGTTHRPDGLAGTGIATYRVAEDLWVTLAGTAAGGWALEWFAARVSATVEQTFGDLASAPPALLMLPYLVGSGTLDNDPSASGVLIGLTLESSTPQIARAVVEASGFEVAKIIAALTERGVSTGDLKVSGSGAENVAALSARAAAAGRTLTPAKPYASARGAAILAARGAGIEAVGLASPQDGAAPAHPDPATAEWYSAQRRRYSDLYLATRNLAHELSAEYPPATKEHTP